MSESRVGPEFAGDATGGPPEIEARPTLNYFNEEFAAQGYQLRNLLRTIVLSKAFSLIQNSPSEERLLAAASSD